MTCDVCGLPDPYNGDGDGIGSCDCPRCLGGEAANWSALCICPPDEDELYATLRAKHLAAADLPEDWHWS